tara:strand:+ start:3031 stop:3669 length:639 start_codon:yes stop_codon:yes gene_type:complete
MSTARDISRQTSIQTVTLTDGQTAVTVTGGFSGSNLDVYLNGARIVQGQDYSLNGTSGITLTQSASADDIIEFAIRNTSNSGFSAADTGQIVDSAVTFGKLSNSGTQADNVQKRTIKAWVSFNAAGTKFQDFNVSSVTDNGPGNYTVNFTTPLEDDDYCCVCTADVKNSITNTMSCIYRKNMSDETEARIIVSRYNNNLTDIDGDVGVIVIR